MTPFDTLAARYPAVAGCLPDIVRATGVLAVSFRSGGKVLVCGNGGSAADSEHIVGELMKGYMLRRPIPPGFRERLLEAHPANGAYLADRLQGALPAISLVSQTSLNTAYANDVAADMAFAQQVYGYGRPGDVLIGISVSGRAANVIHALQVAGALGLHTIALTGRTGGNLLPHSEVAVRVPSDITPDVQECHLAIYHTICLVLEQEFFGA